MPPALNIQNHSQFLDIWNQALVSPKGLAISLETEKAAIELRYRLYYARKAQQRENRKIYPTDHQLHNSSFFDGYTIKVKPSGEAWEVRIEKTDAIQLLDVREL